MTESQSGGSPSYGSPYPSEYPPEYYDEYPNPRFSHRINGRNPEADQAAARRVIQTDPNDPQYFRNVFAHGERDELTGDYIRDITVGNDYLDPPVTIKPTGWSDRHDLLVTAAHLPLVQYPMASEEVLDRYSVDASAFLNALTMQQLVGEAYPAGLVEGGPAAGTDLGTDDMRAAQVAASFAVMESAGYPGYEGVSPADDTETINTELIAGSGFAASLSEVRRDSAENKKLVQDQRAAMTTTGTKRHHREVSTKQKSSHRSHHHDHHDHRSGKSQRTH